MNNIQTNLLGRVAFWFGDRGKEGGPIMAVTTSEHGYFKLLVLVDGKLVERSAQGTNVEG